MVSKRFPALLVVLASSLGLTWLACADLTAPATLSLSITPQHDTLNSIGDALQLHADAVYSNGGAAAGLKWVSLDELVVAVDQTGMAKAVGKGEVMVEVSLADAADTATLVVLAAEGLQDGVPATSLSGDVGSMQFFKFTVPIGSSTLSAALQSVGAASDSSAVTDFQDAANSTAGGSLRVTTTGGIGDVSLYVRFGDVPTGSDSDCESVHSGNDETCEFADPAAGDWYVMVQGADAFQGVTLIAQLSEPTPQHALTVDGAGAGSGVVASDPSGINCTITAGTESGDCSELYDENTPVDLTASADAGSTFGGWSGGGCSGSGTCQVTMSQAQTVTATFELIPQYALTVAGAGTGNGGVTSNPSGINCTIAAGTESGDCSELYDEGTPVDLTASADAGSTFGGWSGAGCSGTGPCQVTMSQAQTVTAAFELTPIPQYDLDVLGAGTGNGGVTSNPSGISCTITGGTESGDCSQTYEEDTQVTLTAQADAGSTFGGWSGGGCSGTGPCQVTMSQAQTVTAAFELIPQYALTVAGSGTGNGGVTSNPSGISCTITAGAATGDCNELYDEDTPVDLTASADAGSTFEGWSGGGCSGTGTCQVTMSQAQTVTATFTTAGGGGSTSPNFMVAFIGDQGAGSDAIAVLQLIGDEGADMVLHQGDFDYSGDPDLWDDNITSVLGADFPYFASVGNHDIGRFYTSDGYQDKLQQRLDRVTGATCTGDLGVNSACEYEGLSFVLSGIGTLGSGHEDYLRDQLAADNSTWRVCSWHRNMTAMQMGSRADDTGWGVYEACRELGAIIATGHEHSYSRTKTLVSIENQTVDPNWTDPALLRVAPGATFVFVSGLGGQSIRGQKRCTPTTYPYGCNGEWASVYTSDQNAQHGALFIEFHVDGDPNKARGYFKNIDGQVVDAFTVTSQLNATSPAISASQSR